MIRGYVSSDEDDYDDYDFGYSEPLIINKKDSSSVLHEIQTPENKEKFQSVLKESQKVELFLKAVDNGDLETVEKFISDGLSADTTDFQGWTPLMRACGEGDFDMVQLLLNHGADSNKHRELFTPLMTCCTYTLVEEDLKLNCTRLLLQHGAEVNAKDKYRTTALMYAAGSGYENIVSELLEQPDIDVNIQDKEGWTALFHAVSHNMTNIVNKLVSAGTDLKLKDRYDRTVLSLALDNDLTEAAKALGYVEKKPPKLKKKKSFRESFLKELPDLNGWGGFCADSKVFLDAFDVKKIKNFSFPNLLNATEEDLYKIGVKLQYNRLKLLSKGIHRYHLYPWKTLSMHQISWGAPVSLGDIITIAASLGKHLTIMNASLKYVDSRISSRQNKESIDLVVEKETIIFLIEIYNSINKIKVSLQKIIKDIEKVKKEIPGDYIYPYNNRKEGKKFMTFFWHAIGAATVGFLIFYYKSNTNIRGFMKFSSYPFTSLLHLFQLEPFYDNFDEIHVFWRLN